jgi:FkbM family methyltransferase
MNTPPQINLRTFTNDQWVLDKVLYGNFYKIKGLPNDKAVMDIGAHIGYFSILSVLKGAGKVYAYEPFVENYELLINNIKDYKKQIIPYSIGVYPTESNIKINYPVFNKENYYDFNNLPIEQSQDFYRTLCLPLDKILQQYDDSFSLLKISLGYAENEIIRTCENINKFENICCETQCEPQEVQKTLEYLGSKGLKDSWFTQTDEETFVFMASKDKKNSVFEL